MQIRCPQAPKTHKRGTDNSPSLSVKIDANGPSPCHCFSCGSCGTLLSVYAQAAADIGDSVLIAAEHFLREHDAPGLGAALNRGRLDEPATAVAIDGDDENTNWTGYALACSRRIPVYVLERGLAAADIKRWMVGYDEKRSRAVFPIWDVHQTIVGASRRALHKDQEPKYLDTPGLPKKTLFYGEHLIDPTLGHVHLVEGVLDTIFAARCFPNVLGFLGANTMVGAEEFMTGPRLEKLRRWAKTVTLIFDGDEAGRNAVHGYSDAKGRHEPGLAARLRPYFSVRIASLPEGADPASIPANDLREYVNRAR